MRNTTKLLAILLILNLTSCVLQDHQIPGAVRVIRHERVGYATYSYTYDGMNRLARETFVPVGAITPYYIDFTSYDPTNRLLEYIQYFADPIPDLAHEVLRNPDGKITRIRDYCIGGPTCTSGVWYFTYPTANTTEVAFWDNGSLYRGKSLYTFNGAGQNTETKHYSSADVLESTVTSLTFDDKRNLLSFFPEGSLTYPIGVNNVLTSQVTNHLTSAVTNSTYTYEYNPQGWVTKASRDGTVGGILEYEAY